MKKKHLYIVFAIIIATLLSACDKEEKIPSYLRINSFTLTTDYPTEGTNSHKITDAWVYVNGKSIGIFELPATIPVLMEGISEITLGAGIKNNGISSTRISYPFYDYYSQTATLIPESITTINPSTVYKSNTTVTWREDFEGAGFSIIDTISTDTVMKTTTVNPFEGSKCGIVTLDASKTTYFGVSSNSYTLPKNAAPVYLELNYKTNNLFGVGIYSSSIATPQPLLYITPSDGWNKIYIELTSLISEPANSNPFRIYFSMAKSDSVAYPELLLDNIKIVY